MTLSSAVACMEICIYALSKGHPDLGQIGTNTEDPHAPPQHSMVFVHPPDDLMTVLYPLDDWLCGGCGQSRRHMVEGTNSPGAGRKPVEEALMLTPAHNTGLVHPPNGLVKFPVQVCTCHLYSCLLIWKEHAHLGQGGASRAGPHARGRSL